MSAAATTDGPDPGRTRAGAEWRLPLLAAVAVEASAGLPAAAITLRTSSGDEAMVLFTTCMAMAGLVGIVIVPGWVWAPRVSLPHLVLRSVLLAFTVAAAAFAAAVVAFLGVVTWLAIIPGVGEAGFVLCIIVAGAVAGFSAFVADAMDRRSGAVHGRRASHVLAGVVGSLVVLGAAALVGWRTASLGNSTFRPLPWQFGALAPAALVLGGGLHHVLLARDGWRASVGAPPARPVAARAAVVCAACAAAACAVLVLA